MVVVDSVSAVQLPSCRPQFRDPYPREIMRALKSDKSEATCGTAAVASSLL